jgi:hypothetical protein
VTLADRTDPEAVHDAIAEFEARGPDAFLSKYGFKLARDYFLVVDGKRYDSRPSRASPQARAHRSAGAP